MVVLPFANLTGEPGWDYLGKDMGVELTTLMGAFPNMHVVAGSSLGGADQDVRRCGGQAGARYVLAGAVDKVNDRLRYTAQLFDGASGHELWSARYDDEGVDPKAPGPDIATRIYDALAGLEGRLYAEEERRSWSKDEASLDAYDYYLRGASLFLRFTPADNEKARTVFAEGLKKYPNEALLQVKLAWCFLHEDVEYQVSKDPRGDIERAWARSAISQGRAVAIAFGDLSAAPADGVSLSISRRRLHAFDRRGEGRDVDGALRNHVACGPFRRTGERRRRQRSHRLGRAGGEQRSKPASMVL